MLDLAKLFEGIATLLWPGIVIMLLFIFKPAVTALIESAKSRKFTLKIGGQELTMEEANAQQRTLINDLQSQILEIQKKIGYSSKPISTSQASSLSTINNQQFSILWVDDQPKNNGYFVQQLADKGLSIDLALSSAEGFKQFNQNQYNLVISDMGRTEAETYNPTAGLDFLKKIRMQNTDIPFIIFCSAHAARKYAAEAELLGATITTSSPTELMGEIQKVSERDVQVH